MTRAFRIRAQRCTGRPPHRQRGQALAEALLASIALGACAYAIAWTGRLQHQAIATSQDSRVAAFTAARGSLPASLSGASRLRAERIDGPLPASGGNAADGAQGRLADEWLRVDWRLMRLQAERRIEPGVGLEQARGMGAAMSDMAVADGGATLRRYTALAEGAGHAASDQAGHQRIAAGTLGWRGAAQVSQSLSRTLRQRIGAIDAAWGGRKPDDDWLSIWSDLAPADRVRTTVRRTGGQP